MKTLKHQICILPPNPPKPRHHENHPACDTPNPPWWCDDVEPANVAGDIVLLLGLIIGIILGFYYSLKPRR